MEFLIMSTSDDSKFFVHTELENSINVFKTKSTLSNKTTTK